jgi:hypothetical protein
MLGFMISDFLILSDVLIISDFLFLQIFFIRYSPNNSVVILNVPTYCLVR